MPRQAYPTDLSDAEWTVLAPLIPVAKPGGRPPAHARRELVNAIRYVVRGGITWRAMPHDLPPWQTVHHYFRHWRLDGVWERANTILRVDLRQRSGRAAAPTTTILDSQSTHTTEKEGSVDTLVPRNRVDASGICWWTRADSSCASWSIRPT